MSDYTRAKKLQLTTVNRWKERREHHPTSKRLMAFLKTLDSKEYANHFMWKTRKKVDDGTVLMYQLDAFFDLLDKMENL